jgi:ribosomal-protein-alanine N-acetyltransferase
MDRRGERTAPHLVTARLRLEPFTDADLEALHALWTDPGVRRFLWDDEVISRDTVRQVIAAAAADFDRDGLCLWTLHEGESADVCGFCGLRPLSGRGPEIELLYALYPRLWGRGLAVEASRAALADGFRRVGLARILAITDAPNTASERVMQKLGMHFVKRALHDGLDTVFYAIDAATFAAARSRRAG